MRYECRQEYHHAMRILGGIASTTHLDRHGQIVDKAVLDRSADGMKAAYVPLLINHDFSKQIGVVLNARVVELADGEYALLVVHGEFETDDDVARFQTGAPNVVWREHEQFLNEVEAATKNLELPSSEVTTDDTVDPPTIADLLELHLDSTEVSPDGSVTLVKRHITSVGGLEIHVYLKDHEPPHFHVISKQRKIDARFHIETLELISMKHGQIREKEVRKIRDFFDKRPDKLAELRAEYKRSK